MDRVHVPQSQPAHRAARDQAGQRFEGVPLLERERVSRLLAVIDRLDDDGRALRNRPRRNEDAGLQVLSDDRVVSIGIRGALPAVGARRAQRTARDPELDRQRLPIDQRERLACRDVLRGLLCQE